LSCSNNAAHRHDGSQNHDYILKIRPC
jgi:hypothetical protein